MGAVARGWYVDGISPTSSIDDASAANNIGSGRIIGGRTCGIVKTEPRCMWPAWTSRWSSTCQDQRPLRTIWAIKKFTDGLQRLHHVKWQASRVRRPSNMFTEVARLLAASASRALKLLGFGLQWQYADHVRKKMGLHLETCQAGDHQICSFNWAHNFWTFSHSKAHLEQMMKELTEEAER